MNKQLILDFLQACEEVYIKPKTDESTRCHIRMEIGQVSLSVNLSGHGDVLKEIIAEYKDKMTVVKYLGDHKNE